MFKRFSRATGVLHSEFGAIFATRVELEVLNISVIMKVVQVKN